MNLFIYVLLLSIGTNSCLNTNQSDGSSTTGAKHPESMETKMDSFRKHLLIIIIGVMIVTFVFTCICFLHYNFMSDNAPKARRVKEKGVAPKSSRSSKISFSESKRARPCSPEKQPMLSGIDKLSGLSSPEKSSIPSSAEKLIRPSSRRKSSKSSSSGKVFRPPQLKKSRRMCHLEKSHNLAQAHKLVSQISSSYPNKVVRPPCPASLQCTVGPTKPPCLPSPQNQILPPKPFGLQKLIKSPRHPNLKRSVSTGRADMSSTPQLVKPCRWYKEKCLVCGTSSEPLINDISEAKEKNAQYPPFPRELKSFSESFHKVDSRHNACCDNVSDSDRMTYDSDDSEREITFICNIKHNEVIPKGMQNN
ncbi:PREDICTED: uncharacterized protein CXorf66 homolog [Ceratotherium simum simum]|uniref:Uncharacterized protein CXorf66 homolog n=1 Tax=Ceratotherium simum simum TaxID=73337 RepID=A0ABM0I6Y0_CERSS|nr:PREDICTED: uncharacterized protein CXorf66 homolog [Ceratotherium simum simum]